LLSSVKTLSNYTQDGRIRNKNFLAASVGPVVIMTSRIATINRSCGPGGIGTQARKIPPAARLIFCTLIAALSAIPIAAQSPLPPPPGSITPGSITEAPAGGQSNHVTPPSSGSISGTVVDKDGAVVPNASLVVNSGAFTSHLVSAGDGTFAFTNVPAGSFEIKVSASGFATQTKSGVLQAGESLALPPVQLVVATTVEVNVTKTREEIAEEQVRVQESQRVFGVFPNFYVTYVPDAVPLNTRQKVQLGWKSVIDPVSFGLVGVIAGAEQAADRFPGFGQGAQGYAKRYGAAYADLVTGTFIGSVILPSVLKQDPRYFYKGTGTRKSRFFYALASAVICKGDNGRWQPNYSNVLGSLAAGGLSNLYYPASDRNGAGLTFANAFIGIAGSGMGAVIQEFFLRNITHHAPASQPPQN
jgi:Carboxypeptidase regulatory-like domain